MVHVEVKYGRYKKEIKYWKEVIAITHRRVNQSVERLEYHLTKYHSDHIHNKISSYFETIKFNMDREQNAKIQIERYLNKATDERKKTKGYKRLEHGKKKGYAGIETVEEL